MNKATLKKFKTLLTDKRDEILKKAKQTLEQDMACLLYTSRCV